MGVVVVSAPLPGNAVGRIEAAGHRVVAGTSPYGMGRDGLVRAIQAEPETQALLALLSDPVDAAVIAAAPKLRVVANYAVGVDNLDLAAMKARGILATNTPGVLTEATADLTFALILDACRRVSEGDRWVRRGQWHGWSPTLLLGKPVHGATLGLIGFGRIGQAVARRARGFGMRVLYHQRNRADRTVEAVLEATLVGLEELLASSDIVSLHCPLTPETRGLLNRERLGNMKHGAVLVNASRGPCVDEEALAEALGTGQIFAAGLDVYSQEPRVPPGLAACENAVLAPHLGSADEATREKMALVCVDGIIEVLRGGRPMNVVG